MVQEKEEIGLNGSIFAPTGQFGRRGRSYGHQLGRLPEGVFPLQSRRSSGNDRMRMW